MNCYLIDHRSFAVAMIRLAAGCLLLLNWTPDSAWGIPQSADVYRQQRKQMVEVAVKGAGVRDERVLRAMLSTPRHEFVPKKIRRKRAYLDAGVPIGEKQTISSPFIVAYMTESLDPQPTDKVLEIGTGSGYQAAVLSPLVKEVYSIEIIESLGEQAAKVLKALDYDNVFTKVGDGYLGWEKYAPYDKIIVTCSPEDIPRPLVEQLKEGGLMVVPMGERHQQTLYLMEKRNGEMVRKALRPTLFVPMTGAAEDRRRVLPDPKNPKLLNSDFEEGLDEAGFVKGWYYQRLLELVEDPRNAPHGKHYVEFKCKVPGQLAHVMQAFAIDGRQVPVVKFNVSFACEKVKPGTSEYELPAAILSFYDAEREELGTVKLGPHRGTKRWQHLGREVRVPLATREAIVRIGLFGAVGSAKFDNVTIRAIK